MTLVVTKPAKYAGIGNPIVFKMTRKDTDTLTKGAASGFLTVARAMDLTSSFAIGDKIVLGPNTTPSAGFPAGAFTANVTNVVFSAGTTTITTDHTSTGPGTINFANNLTKRPNHQVQYTVNYNFPGEPQYTLGPFVVQPSELSPDFLIDVKQPLYGVLDPSYPLITITSAESYNYNKRVAFYELDYTEYWLGGSQGSTSTDLGAVFGAKQMVRYINGIAFGTASSGNSFADYATSALHKLPTLFGSRKWPKNFPIFLDVILDLDTHILSVVGKNAAGTTVYNGSGGAGEVGGYAGESICLTSHLSGLNVVRWEIFKRTTGSATPLSETIVYEIEAACPNGIMLMWTNSVGGVDQWVFTYNHVINYTYPNGRKVKRMLLFAENVTPEEWEVLNELNHPGEVYRENLLELSTATNRTDRRNGSQVYMVSEIGDAFSSVALIGVIVVPQENERHTKNTGANFTVAIDLPETFLV